MELAAAGEPEIDRIAQPVVIDAGPAIDRPQQRDRPVGRRPSMVRGDAVEPGLDVPAADGVEEAGEPVAQIAVRLVAVELIGPFRAVWIDRHILFEDNPEGGHGPGLGALIGGIGAAGDLAEEVLRQLPRLVGGDPAVAVDQTRLLGAFRPPSPAR